MKQTWLVSTIFLFQFYSQFALSLTVPNPSEEKVFQTQEIEDASNKSLNVEALETSDLKQLSESTETTLDEKKKDVSKSIVEAQTALHEKKSIQIQVEQLEKQLEYTEKKISDTEIQESRKSAALLKQQSKKLRKEYKQLKIELNSKSDIAQKSLEKSSKQQGEIEQLKEQLHLLELEKTKRYKPGTKVILIGIYLLITIIILFVKNKLVGSLEKKLIYRRVHGHSSRALKIHTFLRISSWSFSILVFAITIFLILELFGFDSTTTLAGAGVFGIAIGFGAQQLIKDVFSGFFLVLSGQYGINDFISVGEFSGNVEDINLRFTKLRNYDGNVIYVPNSEIQTVVNYGKEYANSVIQFYIDVNQDVEQVFSLIREVVNELKTTPDLANEILSDVELLGINAFTPTGVEIKFRIRAAPQSQWLVGREVRLALKKRFDLEGIQLFQFKTFH